MKEAVSNQVIIEDLFFEQDVDILATNYKHGILRSLFIFSRSILFSKRGPQPIIDLVAANSSVAVVFFPNEFHAASQAPILVGIDRVLHLDMHSLALVRQELGLHGTFRESINFIIGALKLKGRRYAGRLTYPLLGWLLYATFRSLLAGKADVTVVTTNMQHPLSIGIAWAALTSGQVSNFFEHATTPRLVFKARGYRRYYVQFEHTRHMMIEQGVKEDQVLALQDAKMMTTPVLVGPLRTVGVCINNLDSIDSIVDITDILLNRGLSIIYRVHDADPRVPQLKELAAQRGVEFDSARTSRIEEFLQRVDLIVSGNSNVIADALTAQKPVIYYWAGLSTLFDYYGLVACFCVPHATNKAQFDSVLTDAIAS